MRTLYSTYEFDLDGRCVRRLSGDNEPTPRQGEDGRWKRYCYKIETDKGLLIIWDDEGHATLTSQIVSIDGVVA